MVVADEKEGDTGIRATLNLGHTFGHAVETGMGYGAWLHGEAVAVGLVMAAEMSRNLGWVDGDIVDRTTKLILKAGLPTTLVNEYCEKEVGSAEYHKMLASLTSETFLDLMSIDKKVSNGELSLVLLRGALGSSILTNKFEQTKLAEVVKKFCGK